MVPMTTSGPKTKCYANKINVLKMLKSYRLLLAITTTTSITITTETMC